ncbi:MAG: hypothetical protein WBZ29_11025 [Methanocella sp.]
MREVPAYSESGMIYMRDIIVAGGSACRFMQPFSMAAGEYGKK